MKVHTVLGLVDPATIGPTMMHEHTIFDIEVTAMDICANSQMHARGGHGYDDLLRTFVPLVHEAGVSDADLRTILVENPQRILAF